MNDARYCPKCSDALTDGGVCESCGYGRKRAPVASDPTRNRCAWQTPGGQRCAYVGTVSASRSQELFCVEHFRCDDDAHGQRVANESHAAVPPDFDYSTANLAALVRRKFANR